MIAPPERAAILALAALLAALGAGLVARAWLDTPAPRRPGPARPDVVEEGEWVIPPGREQVALRFLAPATEAGVSGHAVASVALRGSEVTATLEGGGALVVRAEGHDAPRPVVELRGCEPDPAVVAALEAGSVEDLFVLRAPTPRPAERERPVDPRGRVGMLGPASRLTGLAPPLLVTLALALGALAAFAVRPTAPPAPAPAIRVSPAELGALVVAGALRLALAVMVPLETDEVRPLTSGLPLIFDGHDAWLHPPLFRALALSWTHAIGWRPSDGALLLRLPTVVASILGVALLGAACRRLGRGRPLASFALVAVLVGPAFVPASVLARPYALTVLFGGVIAWAIAERRGSRSRIALALVAAGLAAWTDAVGGAALGLLVLAWLARSGPGAVLRVGIGAAALAIFVAPLVPGIAIAAAHPVLAVHWDDAVARGQDAAAGMASGGPLGMLLRAAAFAVSGLDTWWLGVPALGVAAWMITRAYRARPDLAVAFGLAFGLLVLVGLQRSVRPRNLVALPIAFAALASAAAAPKRERDEPERDR